MKKIGIFSGSFNPIHIGHLAIANWFCEYEDLEEVWFLVTPLNPLKNREGLFDYSLRLRMTRESAAGYPKFVVSDFESTLPVPSYTIDTLRALKKSYPGYLFHLIMGEDSWENINQWKESEALIQEFPIRIYPRKDHPQTIPAHLPNVRKVNAPLLEISSTFIREAIRENKDIRFFLPEPVRNYINEMKQ